MITDGIVTANVCIIPKRPVVSRLLDKNGLSAISVLSDPVSFVLLVVIAAVVVDVVVFIAAFIVVFVVAVATVFVMAVVVVEVTGEVSCFSKLSGTVFVVMTKVVAGIWAVTVTSESLNEELFFNAVSDDTGESTSKWS